MPCGNNDAENQVELIEKLAAIEHDQWIQWSKETALMVNDLLKTIRALEDCKYSNVPSDANKRFIDSEEYFTIKRDAQKRMKRWETLQNTPYADLTEKYKDDDRVWAAKALDTIKR